MKASSLKPELIVVVDDDPLFLKEVKKFLKTEYSTVLTVDTSYEAKDIAMSLTSPAIFLVDFYLQGTDGLKLIKELKEHARTPIKCILVSNETSFNVHADASDMDVDFFCKSFLPGDEPHKPFNLGRKFLSLVGKVGRLLTHDVVMVKDTITGAYTRKGGVDEWIRVWKEMERDKNPTSFVYLDVNDFKEFNDQYKDHRHGNKVLHDIEKSIRRHLRKTDIVIRYGDEFVIILPNIEEGSAKEIAERVRAYISGIRIEVEPDVYRSTSICFGVSSLNPSQMRHNPNHEIGLMIRDFEDLEKRADREMYRDKLAHYKRLVDSGDMSAYKKYRAYLDRFGDMTKVE